MRKTSLVTRFTSSATKQCSHAYIFKIFILNNPPQGPLSSILQCDTFLITGFFSTLSHVTLVSVTRTRIHIQQERQFFFLLRSRDNKFRLAPPLTSNNFSDSLHFQCLYIHTYSSTAIFPRVALKELGAVVPSMKNSVGTDKLFTPVCN